MNVASLMALLQAAASLLISAQSPKTSPAAMQGAINIGSNVVQVVAQARAPIGFVVSPNASIWPNINDLEAAPYLDANGNYVRLGTDAPGASSTVSLLQQYTSFGDINNDGVDDAAVIVNKPTGGGTAIGSVAAPSYFLAAMLNQGGIMFNIADYPLGNSINITSHKVLGGKILINSSTYILLGDQIEAQ